VTNSSAGVVSRHDYKPFGEELGAGIGGRTTGMGFSVADGLRQKFTRKERDIETGLDYFGARYYSSTQGRFTSPDKPFADQFQTNPQSWNTYSYVRNSPCNNIDAKGRCSAPSGLKPGQVGICIEAFIAKRIFKGIGLGDNRTFSGDNKNLTAKFRTELIVSLSPNEAGKVNISQNTEAGISRVLSPATVAIGIPVISAKGTAETTLNGVKSGSDGTSQTTAPVDGDGIARVNASTNARHGFSNIIESGTISTSINFEINTKNAGVSIDAGSTASGYPSMAVYSYTYVNGKIVTTEVWKQKEGSPDALKEPMQPIPDQTRKNP
jgi:RHS repeat-associated protein